MLRQQYFRPFAPSGRRGLQAALAIIPGKFLPFWGSRSNNLSRAGNSASARACTTGKCVTTCSASCKLDVLSAVCVRAVRREPAPFVARVLRTGLTLCLLRCQVPARLVPAGSTATTPPIPECGMGHSPDISDVLESYFSASSDPAKAFQRVSPWIKARIAEGDWDALEQALPRLIGAGLDYTTALSLHRTMQRVSRAAGASNRKTRIAVLGSFTTHQLVSLVEYICMPAALPSKSMKPSMEPSARSCSRRALGSMSSGPNSWSWRRPGATWPSCPRWVMIARRWLERLTRK